jgi:pimeloyl-ACP methyl ester carboxylesterase
MTLHEKQGFSYIDEGTGDTLLLLHGLFGALGNFEHLIAHFSQHYRVIVPMLPITTVSPREASLENLVLWVEKFVDCMALSNINVLGNSLGGHITLLYVLKHPDRIRTMSLTGSSGLFENAFGTTFPQRNNYDFIRDRVAFTFYDPATATKELVDEVFTTVNDNMQGLCIVKVAKSAIHHNLSDRLHEYTCPTLLIWGNQDNITPAFVGEEFQKGIKNSELHFIDKCGHAPMMEQPAQFIAHLEAFLKRHNAHTA